MPGHELIMHCSSDPGSSQNAGIFSLANHWQWRVMEATPRCPYKNVVQHVHWGVEQGDFGDLSRPRIA
eukprot:s166_g13.t2